MNPPLGESFSTTSHLTGLVDVAGATRAPAWQGPELRQLVIRGVTEEGLLLATSHGGAANDLAVVDSPRRADGSARQDLVHLSHRPTGTGGRCQSRRIVVILHRTADNVSTVVDA
jgi:hypothetical protein